MAIADDVAAERVGVVESLVAVGPSARTACGDWTSLDLAAHLVSVERLGGVLAFAVRSLAARGVSPPSRGPEMVDWVIRRERRHGFEHLVDRLRRPSPRLVLRPSVVTLTLFELWTHHDDVAGPNGLVHHVPRHLVEVIPWLVRYQTRRLPAGVRISVQVDDTEHQWTFGPDSGVPVAVGGCCADLVRWLAGRSPQTEIHLSGPDAQVEELRAFVGRV